MSVGIIKGEHYACLYCNTSMTAFGPLFDNADEANLFKSWLTEDPRVLSDSQLQKRHTEWLRTRGLEFDSDDQRDAFVEWLSNGLGDYEVETLQAIFDEWKQTVWDGSP
jgi:hypothetical protein